MTGQIGNATHGEYLSLLSLGWHYRSGRLQPNRSNHAKQQTRSRTSAL